MWNPGATGRASHPLTLKKTMPYEQTCCFGLDLSFQPFFCGGGNLDIRISIEFHYNMSSMESIYLNIINQTFSSSLYSYISFWIGNFLLFFPLTHSRIRFPASHNRTMTWRQLYRNRDLNPPNPPEMFHTPSLWRTFTQQTVAEMVEEKNR